MTPRSLFNVIIKIFGLFFLKELLLNIPSLFTTIFYYFQNSSEELVWSIIVYVSVIVTYAIISAQLLFKTNKIIDKLTLDQGFDQLEFSFEQKKEFPIGISSFAVMKIFLLVLGGYILVDQIPNLFRNIYLYFQQRALRDSTIDFDFTPMIVSACKIIIGLLIIGERNTILEMIENKKNPEMSVEDAPKNVEES